MKAPQETATAVSKLQTGERACTNILGDFFFSVKPEIGDIRLVFGVGGRAE